MAASERPFCQRCKEDFTVGTGTAWHMGLLRPIDTVPKARWQKLQLVDWEVPEGRYLCGNCYYDLTDDD